jgi:CRISPR-associated protein Csm3
MEMKIGGTDNPVIKHPHTQEPYIPGSSLKGKVRALLEMRSGLMHLTKGEPLNIKTFKKLNGEQKKECEMILKLFGAGASEKEAKEAQEIGPTRVAFADCPLDKNWKKEAEKDFLPFIEVKSENTINRIKGTALNPRFTERVPAETKFTFCITLKQMADAEENEALENLLLEGLKLLQTDALGGSGSRGYGRIQFEFDEKIISESTRQFDEIDPFARFTH